MLPCLRVGVHRLNRLVVRGLDGSGQQYVLDKTELSIGRNPASDLHLKDPQVSWQHARLVHDKDHWIIVDLGSSNGTFVRGKRIQQQVLAPGDIVKIGPYAISLEEHDAPSPTSASERTLFAFARQHPPQVAVAQAAEAREPVAHIATARMRRIMHSWSDLDRLFPLLASLKRYRKDEAHHDAVAGLTVAATIVPQSMAYAMLAGLPPQMGLYASILPLVVYALTGAGRHTSVGPVTVDSLIVVLGLGALASVGTSSYIGLAIALTFLVGAVQFTMGVCRLGFLVNFLSYPVLAGFTCATAVITVVGQLKPLLGIEGSAHTLQGESILDALPRGGEIDGATIAIGVSCLAALWLLRWRAPRLPGTLAVLVVSTAAAFALNLDARGVSVLGEVPAGLPTLEWPSLTWSEVRKLMPLALTISLVGFAQTISVGKSLGNRYGYDVDANRELIALGMANVSSSISHGQPVAGSLARSALNASAGAKTQVASIIAAAGVALTALFFAPLFRYLPNATLAAILVVSAIGLIDAREIRYLFKVKVTEGLLLVFTFAMTLAFGVMLGLLIGVIASILLFITLNTRPHAAILGRLPNTNIFRNIRQFPEAQTIPGLVILRIDASLYFANAVFLKEKIHEICDGHGKALKALLLDASAVNDLDSSADTALHQLAKELKEKGISFYIAGVKAPVREVMKRSGLYDTLGGDHFFFTIDAAVKRYQEQAMRAAGQRVAEPV